MPRYNLTCVAVVHWRSCLLSSFAGMALAGSHPSNPFNNDSNERKQINFPERDPKRLCRGKGHTRTEGAYQVAGRTMRHDRKRLPPVVCVQLQAQSKAHERGGGTVAESGQLSVGPRKIHLRTSRNVRKAADNPVQPAPVHDRLARKTCPHCRRGLPISGCREGEKQDSVTPPIRRRMIAKAKAISYGINDLRYITGESSHKKHPEKIYRVLDNLLPSGLDAMGIWNSMQLTLSQHRPIRNSIIRIELSPSREHTWFYDLEDWQKLWQEFAEEFDKQVITDKGGKVRSCPTNLAGSKYTVWLHTESKGKVPHLHAAICRIDEDGNINNDHNIHLRAQRAAERVAQRRGWATAGSIRNRNIPEVSRECMEVLRAMPSWSWAEYRQALVRRGYSVYERKDRKDILRGYALLKGNTKYKASELGVARNLMISKLPRTWQKLHYHERLAAQVNTFQSHRPEPVQRPAAGMDYTHYRSGSVSYMLPSHSGTEQRFYIPEQVLDCFNEEFDYREVANSRELTDMAVALFVGMLDTPALSAGGGGGSQSDLPWRDKDDDDLEWARRCARAATRRLGKKPRTGLRR